MFKTKLLIAAVPLMFAAAVMAGPKGFDHPSGRAGAPQGFENPAASINDVMTRAHGHHVAQLRGRLTKYLGKNHYEFTDLRGDRIEVKLDKDYNWSHLKKDQLIEISGKLDKGFMSPVIYVRDARPVKP